MNVMTGGSVIKKHKEVWIAGFHFYFSFFSYFQIVVSFWVVLELRQLLDRSVPVQVFGFVPRISFLIDDKHPELPLQY